MSRIDTFIDSYGKKLSTTNVKLLEEYDKFLNTTDFFKTPKRIAFIHEENNHMTGGRYYSWFIMLALVEMGHDVTVYSNRNPVFLDDLKMYKKPRIVVSSVSPARLSLTNAHAEIYIGSPIHGARAAINLGRRYGKPAFALIFDPFPAKSKYKTPGYNGWEHLLSDLQGSDVRIITLCSSMSRYVYEWLRKREEDVFEVYPCINSRVLDSKKRVYDREPYAVFISRIVKTKKFEDSVMACKNAGIKLKVISSISGINADQIVSNQGMTDNVEFLWKISDDEKFDVISKASVVISSSQFEGFGMFMAEAIATGTPFVSYEFETFVEQRDYAGAKNIYFAQPGNVNDLTRKLRLALKQKKFDKPSKAFHFENMVKTLKSI